MGFVSPVAAENSELSARVGWVCCRDLVAPDPHLFQRVGSQWQVVWFVSYLFARLPYVSAMASKTALSICERSNF